MRGPKPVFVLRIQAERRVFPATAAAHLSPPVNYANLAGNLPISDGPFHPLLAQQNQPALPNPTGSGLAAA